MKTITLPILFALLLLTASGGFSAVPDKIDGYVYYEGVSVVGSGAARTFYTRALVLKNDGTYTGLFQNTSTPLIPPFTPRTSALVDGTYTYRKIDDQNAELNLSLPINGGAAAKRLLRFTSDLGGFMPAGDLPLPVSSASFSFAPLSSRAPLANCSNRSFVRAGGSVFTGFVAGNGGSGLALVRAIGPTLSAFGVAGSLRHPTLTIVNASTNVVAATNDDWSSESAQAISRTGAIVGAFPLTDNSKDSAVIVSLAAGAYIAQVSSTDTSDSGEALIEVYLLP